tara:strand:- start:99 stop:581 length:483 start_codon:yes stop_codon:yes gene_type:complete
MISTEYNYDEPIASNDFIEKIGFVFDLSEQYVITCCEVFDDLNKKIDFRGRTLMCVQAAIVYAVAPKYGYIISAINLSDFAECTETEINSAVKMIKEHIFVSFNYEEALLRVASILGIYIGDIQDFVPRPFDYTPPMDIYNYLVLKFPKLKNPIKTVIFN